jgi:hypothetical protein
MPPENPFTDKRLGLPENISPKTYPRWFAPGLEWGVARPLKVNAPAEITGVMEAGVIEAKNEKIAKQFRPGTDGASLGARTAFAAVVGRGYSKSRKQIERIVFWNQRNGGSGRKKAPEFSRVLER